MSVLSLAFASLALVAALPVDAHIAGMNIGPQYEARVRDGIEHNRKSRASIRVIYANGKPVVGAAVKVEQESHDFLFGCAFPAWREPPLKMGLNGWENWNRYFTRLFNYTTSENSFKWGPLESREGYYNWAPVDFMIDWCKQRNIKIKGHTLIWALKSHGVPDWVMERSPDDIEQLAHQRIETIINRSKKDVHIWDVVNEPIHVRGFETAWSKDYAVKSYRWAHEADPSACLVINDYAGFRGAVNEFVPYVQDLIARGAPIDAIGEQAHDSPYWYSPKEIFDTLDKMASTGLPIHLTELTYPSDGSEIIGGFVKGKWDEENQGRFYRYFATLAFSHPNVEALTLWAMWDGSTWLPNGGIIRQDWTPKPAYEALYDLINNQWRTRFEATSDTNGQVRFHGFHGDYKVTVTAGRKSRAAAFHLSKGLDIYTNITLN